MTEEELESQKEALFETAAVQAKTNIKTNFILQEIAGAENISVSDQELIQHLIQIANQRKEEPQKFIKALQKNGRLHGIRNSLLINKAIDFLIGAAEITEITEESNTESA